MKYSYLFYSLFLLGSLTVFSLLGGGCAQIGMPSGGAKDTLAPKIIRANPADQSRNVKTNKITLEFNEYIDVQDLQQNLLVSPLQTKNPSIIIDPRSITIKFRDSLLPNTTYTINFGDAVRDINENNIYKGLTYTFSTGSHLDSLTFSGKVVLAETGLSDSTMLVMLYRNTADSAVQKKRPDYIARVGSDGSFTFKNLPPTPFKVYALKDGDGGKTYNSLSETFAFTENTILPGQINDITLYAYIQEKAADTKPAIKAAPDKRLRLSPESALQDLLDPLVLNFNNPLAFADSNKIIVTDTFYKKYPGTKFTLDSTAKKIKLFAKWQPGEPFFVIVPKDAVKDSAGITLTKNDTLRFSAKRTDDYGRLILRFTNLDLKAKPVLQIFSNNILKYSYPLTGPEWSSNMFLPGDYAIRILYDTDGNGVWSPGNYSKKIQPEIAVTLPQILSVKADWDNEREISL